MADATKELAIVISARDDATKVIKGIGGTFTNLIDDAKTGSFIFAGALAFVGKSIIDVASDMQQTKAAFDVMLGSSEKASASLKKLSDFAKVTPFTFPEVAQGARQLLAYGFSADDLTKNLRMLGDVSAGVKAPLGDLVYLYGTLRAQGRAYTRDIIQFAQRGIPIYESLAKVLKVDQMAVKGLVEEGAVGFPEVQKAFELMTSEGSKFGGMMDKQSKTLGGIVSNISDQMVRIAFNIAGISTNAETFGQVVKGGAFDMLAQGAQKVLDVLNFLEPQIKGFLDAFLANVPAVTTLIGALVGGLLAAGVAVVSMLAPLFALIAIGAGVGLVIGQLIEWMGGMDNVVRMVTEAWNFLVSAWMTYVQPSLNTLIQTFQNELMPALQELWNELGPVLQPVIKALAIALGITLLAAIKLMIDILIIFIKTTTFMVEAMTGAVKLIILDANNLKDNIQKIFNAIMGFIDRLVDGWVSGFNAVKNAIMSVVGAIGALISKAQEMADKVKGGGLKIPGFQHGGFVPGGYGDAVPAILHGGERVIPRMGTDVNPGGGGGGGGVTINISGSFSLDSESRVNELAQKIISVLGRENELAAKGVSI